MLIEGLYHVDALELEVASVKATIRLNKDHDIFKGHFPGNPIMPGVCMIQIIKELTEEVVDKKLFLIGCSNIKFMAIINPELNPLLKIEIAITESEDEVKIKNVSSYDETIALKMNATFKIIE